MHDDSEMKMMALERLIPHPRLHQTDHVDVGATRSVAWQAARTTDFAAAPIVRALFDLRTLPVRLHGGQADTRHMRIDDLVAAEHGFRIFGEDIGSSVTVGAIGKVWQPDIEFADVADAGAFAAFDEPGWVKVAWELRCEPRGERVSRVIVELRVTATDDESWRRFTRYFAVIGPFSRFIRRYLLAAFARDLGGAEQAEQLMPLPGDELLPDALGGFTHGVTIRATPDAIWPWLVQMGCTRAGWYSWDVLDNAGVPSAQAIVPELQDVHVGDMLPATPKADASFEVLRLEPPRVLVLGGLFDVDASAGAQLPFRSARPAHFWQVTWAFVLEPLDAAATRLHVRARAATDARQPAGSPRWLGIKLIHHFMETAQLRHLRERVEARA